MPDMGESTGKLCIVSGSLGYSVMARREEWINESHHHSIILVQPK
jgi:hypothetical protein